MHASPIMVRGRITVVQIFYFDSEGRLQLYRVWSDQVVEYVARIRALGGVVSELV